KHLLDRLNACDILLKQNELDPFLKRMVIGNGKWITYDNIKRKRWGSNTGESSKIVAKPGFTARKDLLC
ncbi:Histone-lysine N-methyltransferase SETMAR, partial [Caligus rogercresseyi]